MYRQEKRPRQWAHEICQLPTREERRAHLNKVPEHLRAMVETHVRNAFGKMAEQKARMLAHRNK